MKRVFQLLNEMVRDGQIANYAIVGAIGAIFYVEPFATQDIDVLVVMDSAKSGLIAEVPGLEYLRSRGYAEFRGEAILIDDWPVQFVPVTDPLEEEAYLNAAILVFDDEPVRVTLAEHLVAIMLRVGRLKDLARVQMFLVQGAIDQDVLQDIIRRHGLETNWQDFQTKIR